MDLMIEVETEKLSLLTWPELSVLPDDITPGKASSGQEVRTPFM
jgi:hypothetical protein